MVPLLNNIGTDAAALGVSAFVDQYHLLPRLIH